MEKVKPHKEVFLEALKIIHDNLGQVSYGRLVELLRENIPELKDLIYSDLYPLLFYHNNEMYEVFEREEENNQERKNEYG